MSMTYKVLTEAVEFSLLFDRLEAEGLHWAVTPDRASWQKRQWLDAYMADGVLVLAGYIDGRLAGFMTVFPYRFHAATLCAEIGLCAFRDYARQAVPLCLGALEWAFDHLDVKTLVGHVPGCNHHVLRMLEAVGFHRECLLPGLLWHDRKARFVDGWLVTADRLSIQSARLKEYKYGWLSEHAGSGTDPRKAGNQEPERRCDCSRTGTAGTAEEKQGADGLHHDAESGRDWRPRRDADRQDHAGLGAGDGC